MVRDASINIDFEFRGGAGEGTCPYTNYSVYLPRNEITACRIGFGCCMNKA
jgi:hypothetical protein